VFGDTTDDIEAEDFFESALYYTSGSGLVVEESTAKDPLQPLNPAKSLQSLQERCEKLLQAIEEEPSRELGSSISFLADDCASPSMGRKGQSWVGRCGRAHTNLRNFVFINLIGKQA